MLTAGACVNGTPVVWMGSKDDLPDKSAGQRLVATAADWRQRTRLPPPENRRTSAGEVPDNDGALQRRRRLQHEESVRTARSVSPAQQSAPPGMTGEAATALPVVHFPVAAVPFPESSSSRHVARHH